MSRSTLDRYEGQGVKVTEQQNVTFDSYSEKTDDIDETIEIDKSVANDGTDFGKQGADSHVVKDEDDVDDYGNRNWGQDKDTNAEIKRSYEPGEDEDYGFDNFDFDKAPGSREEDFEGDRGQFKSPEKIGSHFKEEKGYFDEGIDGTEFLDSILSADEELNEIVADYSDDQKGWSGIEGSAKKIKSGKKKVKKSSRVKFADLDSDQGVDQMVSVAFEQEHY